LSKVGLVRTTIAIGPISVPNKQVLPFPPEENPGFGGSEFHSIELASWLAKAGHDVTILISSGQLEIPEVSVVDLKGVDWSKFDVLIVTTGAIRLLPQEALHISSVAISHHPHDPHLRSVSQLKNCPVVVNVGEYQTWSNQSKKFSSVWLPGFAKGFGDVIRSRPPHNPRNVGYISSLHPSKGFHLVAKAWRVVARRLPMLRLRVLGGLSLYGIDGLHRTIPTTENYARQILAIWGGRIPGSVEFLGKVDGDVRAEISSWCFAILNPAGIGESDPVVVKDCLRAGVPVIGPKWFGMGDYMRHFPEIQITHYSQIPTKALILASNPALREELSQRALMLTSEFEIRTQKSFSLWNQLVENAALPKEKRGQFIGIPVRKPTIFDHLGLIRGWAITRSLWLSQELQSSSKVFGLILSLVKRWGF